MIIKTRIYGLISILLVITMFSSVMLTVTAQEVTSSAGNSAFQAPQNFVDPVTLKIQEFRSQGLNNDQITAKLTELGMGWIQKRAQLGWEPR